MLRPIEARIQLVRVLVTLIGSTLSISAQTSVSLSYLGTAGWEITDGKTIVLIDPYISRLKLVTPNDSPSDDDPRPLLTLSGVAKSDTAAIDGRIRRADYILITHTHFDHALDMPYIAIKTGATVIGTESTAIFARANGVPNQQLVVVKGGEDYQFNTLSVKVIPSLHGVLRRAPNVSAASGPRPTVFPVDAKPPFRLDDLLIEGGTLAYLVRLGGRQILAFGSMNFIEREVDGLRPDAALIGAMPERREIYEYTARLLKLLGYPHMVLPTHWDRFNVTYEVSQEPAIKRLESFIAEVKAVSPKTQVVVPSYFHPIPIEKQ